MALIAFGGTDKTMSGHMLYLSEIVVPEPLGDPAGPQLAGMLDLEVAGFEFFHQIIHRALQLFAAFIAVKELEPYFVFSTKIPL